MKVNRRKNVSFNSFRHQVNRRRLDVSPGRVVGRYP